MRAAAAQRARLVAGRPKMLRELPRPIISAHHLGGNAGIGPYPDNARESIDFLLADGETVMNYQSLQKTSDGSIVVIHDSTVDRTLNGTGRVDSMTLAQFKALKQMPSKGWYGFPDNVWGTYTHDEMVAYLAARGVHKPECNQTGVGDAATYVNAYTRRGLQDYVQIDTGSTANGAAALAAGLSASLVVAAGTTVAALQAIWPPGQGVIQVDYYQASPPGGSITAYIQALIQAGYRVQVYQLNRKSDCEDAIAAAAAVGGELDGIVSNDPVYHNPHIWRPRDTDSFATGRYGHGFVAGAGGGLGVRAYFYPGARCGWTNRDAPGSAAWYLLGEISPRTRPFTLTFKAVIEGLSGLASTTISGPLVTRDVNYAISGSARADGYFWSYNVTSGLLTLFKNSGSGATQSTLGTKASPPPVMPLKLTAPLAAGAPITALPVRAVPAAIPAGTTFLIPAGTDVLEVTTSAVTPVNATSVPIGSVTPPVAVSAFTRLPQQIPFSVQLTPTQTIFKRLDTGATITANDAAFSRLFAFFGKQANATTVTFADGVTTAGSPVVTSPALAAFVLSSDEDKVLTHPNIPAGTQILSVDSPTQVTLTAPATASGSGLTMTLYRPQNAVSYRSIAVAA